MRVMNDEVAELRRQLVERDAEIERLQTIIDEDMVYPDHPIETGSVVDEIRAKGGEVGAILGPPIKGTTDTLNSGPPVASKRHSRSMGTDYIHSDRDEC